jgi:hypothetical protein
MNNLIGYIIHEHSKLDDIGSAYNYRLAGNGLFIMTLGQHIEAQIKIAEISIRGLTKADSFINLRHGRVPQRFWDLALSVMLADPEREKYVGIIWKDGRYDIYYPEQTGTGSGVEYRAAENVVVELHSHPGMPPCFSSIDDKDEQGLKIYGVVGLRPANLPLYPSVNLRIGVYGYWMPVTWEEVFEGQLQGVNDVVELEKEGQK